MKSLLTRIHVAASGATPTLISELASPEEASTFTEDAVLATSEIVANSLQYSEGPCELRVFVGPERVLRVEVDDPSSDLPPEVIVAPDAEQISGRGLHIVSQLCSRWGARRRTHGKTVWFEMDRRA